MKKQTGIWIDQSEAIIVTFTEGDSSVKKVASGIGQQDNESETRSQMGGQHLNDEEKVEKREEHQLQQFFNEILSSIADVQELYLFGPAQTKFKFEKKINGENNLSFKLLKTETADSMTGNQVTAAVRTFFKL